MGGSTKQTTNTTQNATTNPYGPTMPTLDNLIGQVGAQTGNTGATSGETNALNGLAGNSYNMMPAASGANSLSQALMTGGQDRSGTAMQGYGQLQAGLLPIANQSTNPYDNQAFTNATGVMTNDIMDRIKSQYAGSGYSPTGSGDFSQQVGRGVAQGIAPTFLQAQDSLTNQRMGATNALYGGGNATAGLLSGLDQQGFANRAAGVNMGQQAAAMQNSPFQQQLAVEAQRRGIPIQNIGQLENLMVPMAQLGGTKQSNGTQESSTEVPLAQQIMGGAMGGAGLLGQMGAFGPSGWLMSGGGAGAAGAAGMGSMGGMASALPSLFMLSDRRAKEDIEAVGALKDGTPVYRFRYRGQPQVHIGLMAQDVEQYAPDAVLERDGIKYVDYGKATERAMELR